MNKMKNIILWDWNGTLLDDVEVCVEAMNRLLQRRGMGFIDINRYREVFDFPVKKYYSRLGFDFEKEPFEIPAIEFINEYKELLKAVMLFEDVERTLKHFSEAGCKQYIISAMESTALTASVKDRNIYEYFEGVYGIDDDYAHGKYCLFEKFIATDERNLDEILMIGDTLHDYEIANKLGVDICLVARGHQSAKRLKATGNNVIENFNMLLNKEFCK